MFVDEKALGEECFDEVAFKKQVNDLADIKPLIGWLETKDPKEAYDYMACRSCLFSQYLSARGVKSPMGHEAWFQLHNKYRGVAAHRPQTFGDALQRAKDGKFEFDTNGYVL